MISVFGQGISTQIFCVLYLVFHSILFIERLLRFGAALNSVTTIFDTFFIRMHDDESMRKIHNFFLLIFIAIANELDFLCF